MNIHSVRDFLKLEDKRKYETKTYVIGFSGKQRIYHGDVFYDSTDNIFYMLFDEKQYKPR